MDNYQQCSQLTPFATKDLQSCLVCPQDKPVFNLGMLFINNLGTR